MIFVTVGNSHFDRLIREVDRLVQKGAIREQVFAQIGQGRYTPQKLDWVRYIDDIESHYRRSRLVICHGGVGTVMNLLQLGREFIAVANRSLKDDHQTELLTALEAQGWCRCCYRIKDLEAMLSKPFQPCPYPGCSCGATAIWNDILKHLVPDGAVQGADTQVSSGAGMP